MNRNGSFWCIYGCFHNFMVNRHNFGATSISDMAQAAVFELKKKPKESVHNHSRLKIPFSSHPIFPNSAHVQNR